MKFSNVKISSRIIGSSAMKFRILNHYFRSTQRSRLVLFTVTIARPTASCQTGGGGYKAKNWCPQFLALHPQFGTMQLRPLFQRKTATGNNDDIGRELTVWQWRRSCCRACSRWVTSCQSFCWINRHIERQLHHQSPPAVDQHAPPLYTVTENTDDRHTPSL